jgi:hypothetical protein
MIGGSSFGVIGVFLVLLGVGLILDADWMRRDGCLVASDAWCLWTERPRPRREGEASE